MMAIACIEPEAVDAVLAYPADHPQRVHADRCPRCRALLDSYRLFLNPSDLESAPHADHAVREIDARLARTIGAHRPPENAPGRGGTWWLERLFPPVLRPVYALALVAIVIGAALLAPRTGTRREPEVVLRGGSESDREIAVERARWTAEEIDLAWSSWPGADGYRVRFYAAPHLEEVGALGPVADTTLRVSAAELPFRADTTGPLLFRVQALQGGDVIGASAARSLERP